MKYIVDFVSKNSGRLGSLIQLESGRKYETPIALQATKGGSIPYLSREVFDYLKIDVPILRLSLANISQMAEAVKEYNNRTAEFVGFKGSPVVLTVSDPTEIEPSGSNDQNTVPVFTRRGKETITAEEYMDFVDAFQPEIFQSLCDSDTYEGCSKKRIRKSLDRSTDFFNICSKRHKQSATLSKKFFLASIVGGYDKYTRSESIKIIKTNPDVSGYIIEGFHKNGASAHTQINVELLKETVDHCINELQDDKPRMLSGAIPPIAVLEMVRLGVDIFDNSYAYIVTKSLGALTFALNSDNEVSETEFVLNLRDKKYQEDFSPLLKNCSCLTCEKHTKAYIHHLVNTKELLATILLMIHNIHHYEKFFEVIRKSVADNTLPELIDLVKAQTTKAQKQTENSEAAEQIKGQIGQLETELMREKEKLQAATGKVFYNLV